MKRVALALILLISLTFGGICVFASAEIDKCVPYEVTAHVEKTDRVMLYELYEPEIVYYYDCNIVGKGEKFSYASHNKLETGDYDAVIYRYEFGEHHIDVLTSIPALTGITDCREHLKREMQGIANLDKQLELQYQALVMCIGEANAIISLVMLAVIWVMFITLIVAIVYKRDDVEAY